MRLTPVERHTLKHLLIEGHDAAGNIGDADDEDLPHPRSVSRTLPKMADKGLVEPKGSGVWKLTPLGVATARSLDIEWDSEI